MEGTSRISSPSGTRIAVLPETDVFVVDVHIQKAADLALFIAQMRLQVRNFWSSVEKSSPRLATACNSSVPAVCRRVLLGYRL